MGGEVTELLRELREGDRLALDRIMPLVYEELLRLARVHRARLGDGRAPGTVSIVHEAYVRLADQERIDSASRAQFFALASRVMRSVLVDNARWHNRKKRGGGVEPVPLSEELLVSESRADDLLAIDEALTRLENTDERLGRIVECRFFGGLTVDETAEALGVSSASVKRGWNLARSWLYRELEPSVAF
jgi:RNA polymerase sigma factor (TIGR02999 family)